MNGVCIDGSSKYMTQLMKANALVNVRIVDVQAKWYNGVHAKCHISTFEGSTWQAITIPPRWAAKMTHTMHRVAIS